MGVANISGNILTDSGASLSSYLPLTGGTLTGALNGTTATFSGLTVNSGNAVLNTYFKTGTSSGWDVKTYFTGGNIGSETFLYLGYAGGETDTFIQRGSNGRLDLGTSSTARFSIASTGAATFSSSVESAGQIKTTFAGQSISINAASPNSVRIQLQNNSIGNSGVCVESSTGGDQFSGTSAYSMAIGTFTSRELFLGTNSVARLRIATNGDVFIRTALRISDEATWGLSIYKYSSTNSPIIEADGGQSISFARGGSESMRITSNGHVWIGQTSTSDPVSSNISGIAFEGSLGSGKFSRSGNAALDVNRVTNDGELQRFYQDGIQEGSISVSGATVSYNSFLGSHWSQLQDGSRTEILKGTILEAIDELCVWENESNDRLPKSKISDTIESKNVYGTFFDWDNDWQGSNDFYVSSVGLGFIRVNRNEIIEIGDLLQSNGDGTAKVQSDDIMRSSTIAKVVSTQKIETYADGSYLIAATLHCG